MSYITNYLKSFIISLMLGLRSAEKTTFTSVGADSNQEDDVNQGTLADDLLKGKITQEVKNLRWRMYKVLKATSSLVTNSEMGEDGYIRFTTKKRDRSNELRKIKVDSYDEYPLEMVINNKIESDTLVNALDSNAVVSTENIDNDVYGGGKSTSLGQISSNYMESIFKPELHITIKRSLRPKFELEKYSPKINIRTIDEDTKLIEFYISKYPDEYDRKTNLLISDIKKTIINPRASTLILLDEISFITYNDIGVDNGLQFKYDEIFFDKIIEFDGYYVIKFKCNVVVDGEDITEKYRELDLDKKYENKEKK